MNAITAYLHDKKFSVSGLRLDVYYQKVDGAHAHSSLIATIYCFTSFCGLVKIAGRIGEGTWLILPVVICLSQRLSHACLNMSLKLVKLRMAH